MFNSIMYLMNKQIINVKIKKNINLESLKVINNCDICFNLCFILLLDVNVFILDLSRHKVYKKQHDNKNKIRKINQVIVLNKEMINNIQ